MCMHGLRDLNQHLHFTEGDKGGTRGAAICSELHSQLWTLSSFMTVSIFLCEILMPLWASRTMTCADDFKSREFLEVIRPPVKPACKKPWFLGRRASFWALYPGFHWAVPL